MILAEVTIFGMVIFGLVVLGGFAIGTLHYGPRRKWKQHIGSFALGASIGGFLALVFLHHFGDDYFLFCGNFLETIGMGIIVDSFFWEAGGNLPAIALFLGCMLLGGFLMWFWFNRWSSNGDEGI